MSILRLNALSRGLRRVQYLQAKLHLAHWTRSCLFNEPPSRSFFSPEATIHLGSLETAPAYCAIVNSPGSWRLVGRVEGASGHFHWSGQALIVEGPSDSIKHKETVCCKSLWLRRFSPLPSPVVTCESRVSSVVLSTIETANLKVKKKWRKQKKTGENETGRIRAAYFWHLDDWNLTLG